MKSFENTLPILVIAPGFVLGFAFIYGFMVWNGILSVTASRMLPNYDEFVGLEQYARLWEMDRWWLALRNLGVFSVLYVGGSMVLGMGLAIFLDQKIRFEGLLRTIYLCDYFTNPIFRREITRLLLRPTLVKPHAAAYAQVGVRKKPATMCGNFWSRRNACETAAFISSLV